MRPLNFDTPVIDEFGDIHTLEEYAGGGGATDISEKEVSFISDDELNPSAEKVVSVMTTGSKLKDLMSLLSKAVSNLRYVLSFIKSNRDMITDEYDSTRSYVVDDYCTHNGIVYKCIVNTSGTFNDSDWLDTTITTELSGLNTNLSNKADKATTLAGYGITDAQSKLTNPLTQSNVVNNLTSTSTVAPLSANQGKVLNDKLEKIKRISIGGGMYLTRSGNIVCVDGAITAWMTSDIYCPTGYRPAYDLDRLTVANTDTGVALGSYVKSTNRFVKNGNYWHLCAGTSWITSDTFPT